VSSVRLSQSLVVVLRQLLAEPDQWRYGYDLSNATAVPPGTLYPLLVRLADAGWLVAKWEERGEGGRPPRHLYRLTASGRREARDVIARATKRGWAIGLRPREA